MFRQAENEMRFRRLFVWILYILLAQVKGYEEGKSYAWAGVEHEYFFCKVWQVFDGKQSLETLLSFTCAKICIYLV